MDDKKSTPVLRIYVARHCQTCVEAVKLASEIKRRFSELRLELIDLDGAEGLNHDDVFSVPTYVLDGRTLSLGNPFPEELFAQLAEALA